MKILITHVWSHQGELQTQEWSDCQICTLGPCGCDAENGLKQGQGSSRTSPREEPVGPR